MEASPHCVVPQTGSSRLLSTCSDAPAHLRLETIPRAGKPAIPRFSHHQNAVARKRQQQGSTAALATAWPQASPACLSMSAPRPRRRHLVLRAVKEEEQQQQPAEPAREQAQPFYASKLFRVAPVVLLTLGFIDAGYSGDWSRIGAVSSEGEAALRLAAIVVVPTSAVLIWLIVRKRPGESTE